MELGMIRPINIDVEMQASYLDYAMSVIVARALPDARDGLKPVHRRILYAMHDLGLSPDKPYKKSARIVGEVLGKYHPHGDVAVYEAMVRMAQDFSLRYPLVDGQGNFGSIDGDNAAAMRYTEARLSRIALEMLADIEKDTVDWADNFDGTLNEPTVLPAALPNLLVNGASGIAVGMSTNIPPHNLGEVCDALCYLIDRFDHHDDVTVEDLMQFVPGPDFPTGGVVYRFAQEGNGEEATQTDVIAHAYAGGKGSIVMQAKAHIEDMSRNRSRIVVTELPYMANKTNLLERIAELVRDGRLEGITDLRDESDRTGMRICIEMTRTVEPRRVLADLFKLTPLQTTFGVSLLALVDGEPRLLSLKRMLLHFIEHRQEVIVRRSRHDLEKARHRAHILEGLLRALDVLDEVIALIRKSRTAETARQNLIEEFKFTEVQAQAILDMQLRRLAALERRRLQDEYREVVALIRDLEALLASPKKILELIRQNLVDLKARFGDARRTQIADRVKGTLTAMDVLPDEDIWVTLAADGSLARQRRRGEGDWESGRKGVVLPFSHSPTLLIAANTRHNLYLFSAKGQATRVPAHQIPEAPGGHYADLSGLTRRDRVVAMLSVPHDRAPLDTDVLLLVTAQGKVKRVAFGDLFDVAQADPAVIGLDDGDELLWVGASAGGGEFMLITATGQAIRFSEDEVRTMGLPAGGIGGIRLAAKDRVVVAMCVAGESANQRISESARPIHLALVTTAGYGKRVPVADFPAQGRNGQGVVAAKLTDKSGEIAGAALVTSRDVLICAFAKVVARPVVSADLAEMGRPAQGKPIVGLMVGQPVKSVCVLSMSTESRTPGGDTPKPDEAEDKTAPAAPAKRRTTKAATAPETASGHEPAAPRTATKAPAKTAATRKSTASPAPQAETTAGTKGAGRRVKTDAPASVAPVARAVPVKVDATKAAPPPDASAKPAARVSRAAPKTAPKGEAEQLSLIPAAAPAPEEAPQRRRSTAADGAKPASKPAAATKAKPTPPTKEDQDAAAGPAPKPGRASKQSEAASPPRTPARKP